MRLNIIDGIRGHLLLGMMVAHLSFQPGLDWLRWLHHHTLIGMYDGEFFVLIAGLLVGVLTCKRTSMRANIRPFLMARIKIIYRYYLIAALPFLLFTTLAEGLGSLPESAVNILVMIEGGAYSDILPIYFYCFVLLLALMVVIPQNFNVALAVSAVIYVYSQFYYDTGFMGLSSRFVVFDVAAWQFLFILSLYTGLHHEAVLRALDRLPEVAKALLALVLGLGVLAASRYLTYPAIAELPALAPSNWARMNLHPFYLLQIIAFALVVFLVLSSNSKLLSPLKTISTLYFRFRVLRNVGSYSIQMFTLHVYFMAIYKQVAAPMDDGQRSLLAIFILLLFVAAPNIRVWMKTRQKISVS